MVLWWIGNAVLFFVVLPVVIALLNRVLSAVERIRAASDDILTHGVELTVELNDVPALLATTDATVKQVAVGATRYAGREDHSGGYCTSRAGSGTFRGRRLDASGVRDAARQGGAFRCVCGGSVGRDATIEGRHRSGPREASLRSG